MTNHNNTTFPPMTGRIFETGMGRVRLDRLLGQGGFGAVYEAVALDSPGARRYAVKLIVRNTVTENAQAREIALHEAVSSHANIVDIHYAEFLEDYLFIVLGLCTGGSLLDKLFQGEFQGEGATEKIKLVFGQILDAVEHCHEQGVYHRDLKPENILIEGEGEDMHVLLTDFGVSSDKEYVQSYRCGTQAYWSPECQGDMGASSYSLEANDVWSLGVILVLMIKNQFPWQVASPKDPLFQAYINDSQRIGASLNISGNAWQLLQMVFTLDESERLGIADIRNILNMMDAFSSSVTNDSSALGSGEVEFSRSQELGVQSVDCVQELVECGVEDERAVCGLVKHTGTTIFHDCLSTFV